MPRLKKYVESSNQTGYYVLANAGRPVTLQTTELAENIFSLLGYTPNEPLPSELVWTMFEFDILYTSKSLDSDSTDRPKTDVTKILEDIESQLDENDLSVLRSYLEDYTGPDEVEVEEFLDRLDDAEIEATEVSEHFDIGSPPQSIAEAKEWLRSQGIEESALATSEESYNKQKYILRSIQTFATHSHKVENSVSIDDHGCLEYKLSRDRDGEIIHIRDDRLREDVDRDYHVRITYSTGGYEICDVEGGFMKNYENIDTKLGARFRMSSMLDWILPENEVEFNPITFPIWVKSNHFEEIMSPNFEGESLNDRPIQELESMLTDWEQRLQSFVGIDLIQGTKQNSDVADNYWSPSYPLLHLIHKTAEEPLRIEEAATRIEDRIEDKNVDFGNVEIVTVDRISNSGNPVVTTPGGEYILDNGEKGELYLVTPPTENSSRGTVVGHLDNI